MRVIRDNCLSCGDGVRVVMTLIEAEQVVAALRRKQNPAATKLALRIEECLSKPRVTS